MSRTLNPNDLPNIPGVRPNRVDRSGKKKKGFQIVHGVAMPPNPVPSAETMAAATQSAVEEAQESAARAASLTVRPSSSSTAQWLGQAGRVLQFSAYFNESVQQTQDEDFRVRTCTMFYYLEDDTLQVVEEKKENSGMPQGNFVKRHQVPRGDGSGAFVTLDDIVVGESIVLYGREFFITDCNGSTRAYLEAMGRDCTPAEVPQDPYSTLRADFMSRETGADPDVPRNNLKSPLKKFVEATLGNTINNSGREGFLRYNGVVLRFDTYWDDTNPMELERQRYTVHYFVADDTMEVVENIQANDGKDPFPLLIKRMKIPKAWGVDDANGRADEQPANDFYHWKDIRIGGTLNFFGRENHVVACDTFTRSFYETNGMPLDPDIPGCFPSPESPPPREVPPYNGWGSEADSLANTVSLIPKAPKTAFDMAGSEINRSVLRFAARLNNPIAEDEGRKFVISYYCADGTISVTEPPQRNSGIVGGSFLQRGAYTNAETGVSFTETDFYVGKSVALAGRSFAITDVDEFTLCYMEGKPSVFPLSSAPAVMQGLKKKLIAEGGIVQTFRKYDEDNSGSITVDEFGHILKSYDPDMPEQGVVTLMRLFDKNGDGEVSIQEFVMAMERETGISRRSLDAAASHLTEYGDVASQTAAATREAIVKNHGVAHFVHTFSESGDQAAIVKQLSGAGADNRAGQIITRDNFVAAVSYAKDQSEAGTLNLNLTEKQANDVADYFFRDAEGKPCVEITYDAFLKEVGMCSKAMGPVSMSSAVGHH